MSREPQGYAQRPSRMRLRSLAHRASSSRIASFPRRATAEAGRSTLTLVVAGSLAGLTACGQPARAPAAVPVSAITLSGDSQKIAPSPLLTPSQSIQDPLAHLADDIAAGRLKVSVQIRDELRLDPVPDSFVPGVSLSEALANYTGAQPRGTARAPIVFLAALTDSVMAKADSQGVWRLEYQHTPVWVIAFHDVYDRGAGSHPYNPTSSPESGHPRHVNVVAFMDALTGQWLFEIDDPLMQPNS